MAAFMLVNYLLSICFLFFLLLGSSTNGHALALERREDTEVHHHTVQLRSLLSESVCSPSTKGANIRRSSSLKVVHRHGPCSQLNKDQAKQVTPEEILSRDQDRVNSIKSRLAFNSGTQGLQDSKVTLPAKSESTIRSASYIVTVGFGTPKKDLSLVFDTGSDLTWIQCKPCVRSCYNQSEPIFDPSLSTSYSNISCSSPLCSDLDSATGITPDCNSSTCMYGIEYADHSTSVGLFGREKLTLTSTDVIDNFLFGCGQNNQGQFGSAAGLLGLGRDKVSIISQAAQKYGSIFSYCLPSRANSIGYLTLGNSGVSSNVKFTPLLNSKGASFYAIDIISMSVSGTNLGISAREFSTSGTIIDSGTVITRLPPAVYSALKTAFRAQMTKYPMTKAFEILNTCYDFSNYSTIIIPVISFLFNGNVKVDLAPEGTLYAKGQSQFCLAFAGNGDASDPAIFGSVQQKTLQVVYNVAGGKLGFSPGGC